MSAFWVYPVAQALHRYGALEYSGPHLHRLPARIQTIADPRPDERGQSMESGTRLILRVGAASAGGQGPNVSRGAVVRRQASRTRRPSYSPIPWEERVGGAC